MAGRPLGQEDRVVDVHVAAGVAAEHGQQPLDAVGKVLALDQVGRGDRPGVDQRIERPIRRFVEHDRIERLAGRLDADLLEHLLAAVVFERQAEHERLRDRLDAEQLLVVADVERSGRRP